MQLKQRASLAGALIISCLILGAANACRRLPEREQYEFQGREMGAPFSVKVVGRALDDNEVAELGVLVESELGLVNQKMSTYLEGSELSRLNAAAGGETVVVSAELLEVLIAARRVGAITGGAFDITIGPLVDVWGFGPPGRPERAPDADERARLLETTGWDRIEIDDAASTVRKTAAEVRCDLSGVAKGYGVDRLSEALERSGFPDHMVEVGGEVRVGGANLQGKPWRIAVERPQTGGRRIHRVLELRDLALATSGDYRNYYEENGVRFAHIIDPRSGEPIRHRLASVSVAEDLCAQADALATGLLVLGEDDGYRVAVENQLAALFLVRNADGSFTEKATPRFESLFGSTAVTGEEE